jgi:hypothetical protein
VCLRVKGAESQHDHCDNSLKRQWQRDSDPWLEARERLSRLPLAGLQRGDDLYLLGLGSPTHPLPRESWAEWTSTYDWRIIYDYELIYAGPLFIHQFSHVWIDFREIQDDFMRGKGMDYFENSRRATHVQRRYAIDNPSDFSGYGENSWGITASDGPGWATDLGGRRTWVGDVQDQRKKEALLRL